MSLVPLGLSPGYHGYSPQPLAMLHPLPCVGKMRALIDTKGSAIAPRAHNIILFISCQGPAGFKQTGQQKGIYNTNCSTLQKIRHLLEGAPRIQI